MCDRKAEFAACGARVVFIGPGLPQHAAAFATEFGCGLPVLCDPKRQTFAALRLRRGLWSVLRPSTLLHSLRALRSGFRQRSVQGDPWQQGGAAVFSAAGELCFALVDRGAGAPLDLDRLIAQVCGPTPAAQSTSR